VATALHISHNLVDPAVLPRAIGQHPAVPSEQDGAGPGLSMRAATICTPQAAPVLADGTESWRGRTRRPDSRAHTPVCIESICTYAFSSWHVAQMNERRNGVVGSRSPSDNPAIPSWCSTSKSSIESARAAIPATRQPAFTSAFTPVFAASRTCRRTSAARPARSARDTTGASPARDTRFGSSKRAEIFSGSCDIRIQQAPF
jgi:hypothetical protein